ncbi:Xaa-Pro dipeptidase [Frankliniella fusca]|uniref:Xaa-Pro dipeptidase n=1 Tax=Frankliniella fusca TaxID=407009 RepID=A0AAE1HRX6_9NEOP|nr:Xaa-Pro dipeptidase [Frankliniella fusca]
MSFEKVGNNNNNGYLLAASVECADASHWGETSASPSEFSCLLKVSGMRKELGTGRGESDDRVCGGDSSVFIPKSISNCWPPIIILWWTC